MDTIASTFTQQNRLIRIFSSLGDDVLLLETIEGTEQISALFEFSLMVMSKHDNLIAQDIVGQAVDFELAAQSDGPPRFWNGIVTALRGHGYGALGLRHYTLTIRPFLWMLTQTSDCRILHSKTTQDITSIYLLERGFQNFRFLLLKALPVRDYCVQYNETAYAYLTRLWEEDGLFWWFEHQAGAHTLVISDSTAGYTDAPNPTPKLLLGVARNDSHNTDLHDWHERQNFISGKRTTQDWNFETPRQIVTASSNSMISIAQNATYELYEYPSRAVLPDTVQTAADLRMHAVEADYALVHARCFCRDLAPTLRFTPICYPTGPVMPQYVVTKIAHVAHEGSYFGSHDPSFYEGAIEAMPAMQLATPHRTTKRPRIDGLQMAVVVGPPGEQIFTDQYGRIQVRFPWDRRGDISCWIRVVQPWGGTNWGAMVIPRVGMEVAISFQDGDPDRPICVGAVVNPDNLSPYSLPANKTRMMLRSQSYKSVGYNELSLEDATGNEEYFMHAQKDMNSKVNNNLSLRVDANALESVGFNKGIEVDNNMTQMIGGDFKMAVGPAGKGSLVPSSATGDAAGIGGSAYALGDPKSAPTGTGNLSLLVQQNMTETIQQNRSETVLQNKNSTIGQNCTIDVGKVMTINAGEQIVLQTGDSQIVMKSDGTITINGKTVVAITGGKITHN